MLKGKCEGNGVLKDVEKYINEEKQSRTQKKETKKNGQGKWNEKKPKEKMGQNKDEKKDKENNLSRDEKMILGLITLKHIFGHTYPFFRNPEPRPTLCAVKVHFDWTWILRLKRFFLREFSSKIVLINHPPIWDEFWIFECIMGQSKKKRKWMKRKNVTLEWKPERIV